MKRDCRQAKLGRLAKLIVDKERNITSTKDLIDKLPKVHTKAYNKQKVQTIELKRVKAGHLNLDKLSKDSKKPNIDLGLGGKIKTTLKINNIPMPVLLNECTEGTKLISIELYNTYNIPTKEIKPVTLYIAVKGSKSTITKQAVSGKKYMHYNTTYSIYNSLVHYTNYIHFHFWNV